MPKITSETEAMIIDVDQSIPRHCTKGVCGVCKVKVLSHEGTLSEVSDAEKAKLSENEIKNGYRLACLTKFSGHLEYSK